MFLCDVGVSERDRSGWKFGSPPLLVQPGDPASRFEGHSAITSSGRGGAPGSPGFGRLEAAVEESTGMLTATTPEDETPLFCKDGRLSEPATSELEGLPSPSGWKSRVDLFENIIERWVVVVGVLRLLSDEELEATAAK